MKKFLFAFIILIPLIVGGIFYFWQPDHGRKTLTQAFTANSEVTRERLIESLKAASQQASQGLLSVEGQAKGDFYFRDQKWVSYEAAWHTGQLILALSEVMKLVPDERLIQAAMKANHWWKGLEITQGPLQGFVYADHGDELSGIALFATVSDGTPGIFKFADAEAQRVALQAAEFLLSHNRGTQPGFYFDAIDLKTGQIFRNAPVPPALVTLERINIEGSLFLDAYYFSKEEKFRTAFLEQCEATVAHQDADGLWMSMSPNDKQSGYVHPRFNMWNAEALLRCFDEFKDRKFLTAAKKTADFYAERQRKDGLLALAPQLGEEMEKDLYSSSGLALTGIVWIGIEERTQTPTYRANLEKAAAWILMHQYPNDYAIEDLKGAYKDLKFRKGKKEILNRDLGTIFGLRFLSAYLTLLQE